MPHEYTSTEKQERDRINSTMDQLSRLAASAQNINETVSHHVRRRLCLEPLLDEIRRIVHTLPKYESESEAGD